MTNSWKNYKEDTVLLIEAGFIAVNQADEDSATKLFKAASTIDPKNTLAEVGMGYLYLHKLELKQAVKIFENILKIEPKNEMAKAFLGLCMGLQPNLADKGEKMLEQTAKSKDPLISSLSDMGIDFIEKFVKQTPGPAGRAHK